MKQTKERLEKYVKKLIKDNVISREDSEIALILLASTQVGVDVIEISKYLNISLGKVKKVEKKAIANKIWSQGKINCNWFEKDGVIAFGLDIAVIKGLIERK